MDKIGILLPPKERVSECANSVEGQRLLHLIGVETNDLQPPLSFVPRIEFNGVIYIIIIYSNV